MNVERMSAEAIRARLRELNQLRTKVDNQTMILEAKLANTGEFDRQRRSRHTTPPCGTETAYQRHRWRATKGLEEWPLPVTDPCGCKAAHARHNRLRQALRDEGAA